MSAIVISAHGWRPSWSRAASKTVCRSSSRAASWYGVLPVDTPPIVAAAAVRRISGVAGDRLEVDLVADAAVGASPIVGHLGPRRAGREARARMARLLVVDVAAAGAAVGAHATGRP